MRWPRTLAWIPALVLASSCAAGLVRWSGRREAAERLPGPAPGRRVQGDNARCEGCHEEIAREWRSSEHRTAFTDPVFQQAFAIEPLSFCRGCHAPEAPFAGDDPEMAALGVGCITCHQPDRLVLAAPGGDPARFAPHPVLRRASFASARACAGCHEFDFDDGTRRDVPLAMQRTVSEHAVSGHGATPCADCHMPLIQGGGRPHRSHDFASVRDPATLRKSVTVQAERVGPSGLLLRLRLNDVGHAFPTGDLFRRLAIVVEAEGPEFRVRASKTRYLQRHFAPGRGPGGAEIRVEVGDDRPGHDGRSEQELVMQLGEEAAGLPLSWSVTLQRVLHVRPGREDEATLSGEIELARGSLSPRPPPHLRGEGEAAAAAGKAGFRESPPLLFSSPSPTKMGRGPGGEALTSCEVAGPAAPCPR